MRRGHGSLTHDKLDCASARSAGKVTKQGRPGKFIAEMLELGLRTRKIEQALEQYARGEMTLGAAAHMAGIMEGEMARQAYARGLEPRFTEETLAEDLA